MRVKDALLDQLAVDGIGTVFGNPGTTEENLLDAFREHPDIRYVMTLQESVAGAMADGYARATSQPAVLLLHAVVGVGNAMAMLYQASRSGTPLVVLAGEAPTEFRDLDGFLAADIPRFVEPVTKWATRLAAPNQALRVLRRAIKVAATPPRGPVFIALPMDILELETGETVVPTTFADTRTVPAADAIDRFAAELLSARTPILIIGDGVAVSGAQDELHALSDVIGAPIYGGDFGDLDASFRHPLFAGLIGHAFGEQTRAVTRPADVVLAVGTPLFSELFPVALPYFKPDVRLLQVDLNPWEIAKNFPVTAGAVADPRETLRAVRQRVDELADDSYRAAAAARRQDWERRLAEQRAERERRYSQLRPDDGTLTPAAAMELVVASCPANAIVVDEALTTSDELLHYLRPDDPTQYFLGRGGCIGVGWPSAIGVKLANPDRPVLALSGDGSALYVVQALWTAVRYDLDMVFIVCNNASYRILKVNILHWWASQNVPSAGRAFPYMDLDEPHIEWVKLAEGFGATGWAATDEASLRVAMEGAFATAGVHVVDLALTASVAEEALEVTRAHSGYA